MVPTVRQTPRVATGVEHCARLLAASRRILVLGSSGSGKTTLSRTLARRLEIEPIHLDALFWKPGWIPTDSSTWRETVVSLVQREAWIMDGTYESTLDLRIPAADAMVVVEANRFACLWRVLKRKWTINDAERPDAPPGQPIDRAFLRYVWNYPRVTRPLVERFIERYGRDKRLVVVRPSRGSRLCEQAAVARLPLAPDEATVVKRQAK